MLSSFMLPRQVSFLTDALFVGVVNSVALAAIFATILFFRVTKRGLGMAVYWIKTRSFCTRLKSSVGS